MWHIRKKKCTCGLNVIASIYVSKNVYKNLLINKDKWGSPLVQETPKSPRRGFCRLPYIFDYLLGIPHTVFRNFEVDVVQDNRNQKTSSRKVLVENSHLKEVKSSQTPKILRTSTSFCYRIFKVTKYASVTIYNVEARHNLSF
jgi:hypothetical protein